MGLGMEMEVEMEKQLYHIFISSLPMKKSVGGTT